MPNKDGSLRCVLWDIETSLMSFTGHTLWPKFIPHYAIEQDWTIICACWKVLGQKKVYSVSTLDDPKYGKKPEKVDVYDDYHVVKTLREMLEDVDILIGHNGDKFDLKKFNARLIYHKLPPLPNIVTIDTLKQARKIAKFSSNRLDYIGKYFGVDGKLEHSSGLWERSREGDPKAVKDMVKYNKRDVTLLEDVYLHMRPYMKGHPNIASVDTNNCPKCNSANIHKHKVRITASGIHKQQFQCQDCGGYFTARFSERAKSLSGR